MKYVIRVVYILTAAFFAAYLVYALFYAPEKNYSRIVNSVVNLVMILGLLLGICRRRVIPRRKMYEETYKEVLRGAFAGDSKSYSTLMEVISYFHQKEYRSAHQLLDQLEKECKNTRDYTAVYIFRALIYEEQKLRDKAVEAYEKLLQRDMVNSVAWSNLGLCYRRMDRKEEALEAYTNAIRFDPQNATAYNNMANFYIYTGDMEKALAYALKALELDDKAIQPMGVAAVAYKVMGDEEACERYCRMYAANGGKEKKLRKILSEVAL